MNLVNELQVSAGRDDVITVLRNTKRLASKLSLTDINEWLLAEQEGYKPEQTIPAYRMINGRLAYNTNGLIPAGYGLTMNGVQDYPSEAYNIPIPYTESINSLMALLREDNSNANLYWPISDDYGVVQQLRGTFSQRFAYQITFLYRLSKAQLWTIPEVVKDKVLDWACELEQRGVLGENMTFSEDEKSIAHSVTFNIINSQIDQLNNMGNNFRGQGNG